MKDKKICKGLSFEDCEITILRMAADKAEEKIGKRVVNSEEVQKIILIVENFIKKKNLIVYGGLAINNILPKEDQFYDKDVEIPDYDFFTINALEDAKELSDMYFKEGFTDVEAKSGQHHGTFKVYVNYMPIADLTNIPKEIYFALKKESLRVAGILYAPPNFLRMSMYLELSRPAGDTSRWEKVLKRLTILNKHYPLTSINCHDVDFQRKMEDHANEDKIYNTVQSTLVNQSVIFFGGYAIALYSNYMPLKLRKRFEKIADFDVLSNEPEITAEIIKERLIDNNIKNVKIIKRESVGEIVPEHHEIKVGNDTIVFIYKPIGCHSYNIINIKSQKIKIATIDTMLSFYLAFLFTNRPYYTEFSDRILCMSKFLFEVQQKNRLEQKGLLKRFSITCYGHQDSIEEMRAEKAKKFKELKAKKGTNEYDEWFLNYKPEDNKIINNKNTINNKSIINNNKNNKNNNRKTRKIIKKTKNKNNNKKKNYTFNFWDKNKTIKNKK
jgi:hypothetical protein